MMGKHLLCCLVSFFCVYGTESQSNVIEVDNLNGLSAFMREYEKIFTPNYVNDAENYHQHDIHVVDKFGKFMKLNYAAKHPQNIDILKMDEPNHSSNIDSLLCHDDEHNSIELYFKSSSTAKQYLIMIQNTLSTPDKSYFITAAHHWGCINKTSGRYESVLRQITVIDYDKLDKTKLILHTERASLIDVFETLNLEVRTNIGMHPHRIHKKVIEPESRRLWGLPSWEDVKAVGSALSDGISNKVQEVIDTVQEIKETATKVYQYAMGDPVEFIDTTTYTWSWNYYSRHDDISLSQYSAAMCRNCFAYLDLEYYYKLEIDDYTIRKLIMQMEGDMVINMDVQVNNTVNNAITIRIDEVAVPDFGYNVAGFTFGLFTSGEIEIGLQVDVEPFTFEYRATGRIKKGMIYDYDAGTQNYINENDLMYWKNGPKTKFQTTNIVLYAQPTIYLKLDHVGAVFFGLQPRLNLNYDRVPDSTDSCALYCTPSLSLNTFIGIDIDTLGFQWDKQYKLDMLQPTITDWGGCVEQAKVVQIQTHSPYLDYTPDSWDGYYGYYYYNSSYSYYDYDYDGNRRRMTSSGSTNNINVALIDLSLISIDAYRSDGQNSGWGKSNTQWWANMSTISEICNDWTLSCGGYKGLPILIPTNATLMISVINNKTLLGLYHTFIEVTPTSGWDLDNVDHYTNISCISRELFTLQTNTEHDDIPTYDIQLLEWYCDTNLSHLGIDESDPLHYSAWQCMITLPSTLNAIQLDSSFGNIMLFDGSWCSVFSLTKKPQYTLNYTQLETVNWNRIQWPVDLWYGLWHCGSNYSDTIELYFTKWNITDHFGTVNAVLRFPADDNDDGNWTYNLDYYLNGTIDLKQMTMNLNLNIPGINWTYAFIGLINLFEDGTMTYAGSIDQSGCTGFLLHGYWNVTQFDYIKTARFNHEDNNNIPAISGSNSSSFPTEGAIGFVIGMGTTLIIVGVAFAICRCRNKKKQSPLSYQLMDDNNL
eukprot:399856_1